MGKDSLVPNDQLTLEIARMLREDFLQQNAFMDVDSYSGFDRQERLLALILGYETLGRQALTRGVDLSGLCPISRPVRRSAGPSPCEESTWRSAYDKIERSCRARSVAGRKAGEEQ